MRTKRLTRTAQGLLIDKDPQVFPWDGREEYVYRTIPKLISMRPGHALDFYRTAACFACHPEFMHQEFLEAEALRFVDAVDALAPSVHAYDKNDDIRPDTIRRELMQERIIAARPNVQGGFDWELTDTAVVVLASETEQQWLTLALEAAEVHWRSNGDTKGFKP